MSRYWNGGQNHDIRRVNKPFENVKFKCLGMIGTNKNYIREEIKSRIKPETNAGSPLLCRI
jgi:hypothetical protein